MTANHTIDVDDYKNKDVTGWVGWSFFAGFLMLLSGVFQMIAGFVALFKQEVFLVNQNNLVVFNFDQWGWIHIIIGIVLVLAAFSVFRGGIVGRLIAIFLASVSAIANFAFIDAYPLWSITIIVIDILIIYGVAVHGGELKE